MLGDLEDLNDLVGTMNKAAKKKFADSVLDLKLLDAEHLSA